MVSVPIDPTTANPAALSLDTLPAALENLVTPDEWRRLHAEWAQHSADLKARDGSDPKYPINITDNPGLQAKLDDVFVGFVRVFAERKKAIAENVLHLRTAPELFRHRPAGREDEDHGEGIMMDGKYNVAVHTSTSAEELQSSPFNLPPPPRVG